MSESYLFGFHAVQARLKVSAPSIECVWVDVARRDGRMQQLLHKLQHAGVAVQAVAASQLHAMAGHKNHQGVLAKAGAIQHPGDLFDIVIEQGPKLLLLVLDGVTDPHNLGACLRTADAVGVHAVVVPKNNSVGLGPTVSKVASGAAESIPFFVVTNLARCLQQLQEAGVWCIGTSGEATQSLYQAKLSAGPLAWVMGAEGSGLRRLTTERCDELVHIPMYGSVESLNVSVASAVCLYETIRQRALG